MTQVSGIGNWEITFRSVADGAEILSAETCDEYAVLPDEICGLPVVSLSDHALAPGRRGISGEEIRITCGSREPEYSNSRIRELTLPAGLRAVGSYAFMNCRALKTVNMHDGIESFGTGVFMNCVEFSSLRITRHAEESVTLLAAVVSPLNRELDVTVDSPSGERMRLVFPDYREIQTENGPTHFFNYNIEGGGYPYRGVFRKRLFSAEDYDSLWPWYISHDHDEAAAVRLAWRRLRYPVQLSPEAGERYRDYILKNSKAAAELILTERDVRGLELLLGIPGLPEETVSEARRISREQGFTEATALLLERRRRGSRASSCRSFDL